jgi:hypothetical protein
MSRNSRSSGGGLGAWTAMAVLALLSLDAHGAAAQEWALGNSRPADGDAYPAKVTLIPNPRTDMTFARDVAPILQENCQTCHRPGNVAPMSLLTYEDVRPWARVIRERVIRRTMPPWPVDRGVGIQEYKNDPSLSDEEIRTIVDWVDAGAPLGDRAELPAPVEWPDGRAWEFQDELGDPDMVYQSPLFNVVADGMDKWPTPITPLDEAQVEGQPLTTERWIKAIAVRPHNFESRYVFHHANPGLILPGAAPDPMEREGGVKLIDSAVGTEGRIFPEDQGRLIRPGSEISWGMHYHPYDRDIEAALQVAVWLYPEGYVPKHYSMGDVQMQTSATTHAGGYVDRGGARDPNGRFHDHSDVLIPPHSVATIKGVHVLDRPAMVHSVRGHMHMRGKYQVLEAVYPDGSWETLTKLNWDHGWHTLFLYEDHVMPLLPKGTVLILTSTFDNTTENPHNPDPNQWVTGGDRSVDEMGHIRLGMTYFDSDADFQDAVLERERKQAEVNQRLTAAP